MPAPYKLNRRFRRIQSISSDSPKSKQLKPRNTKCLSAIKIIKVISAILVPLMIGVFTLITTLHESKSVQLQQQAEQQRRELDMLKIKEQQQRDDINAKEIRMQNIYDTFMKEISSIVLKDNINLTKAEITFARAKTLLTLEQIDSKRKWYLVKFLYDNQLLNANQRNLKYLDLAGADFSNVSFGGERRYARLIDLKDILLAKLQLKNSTFENVDLKQANFDYSDLNGSNFISASVAGVQFKNTVMENTNLVLLTVMNSSFKNSRLKSSSWSSASLSQGLLFNYVDYSDCDLSESTFQGSSIKAHVKFDEVNFERINFIDVIFASGMSFNGRNMQAAKFIRVVLDRGSFVRCNMIDTVFERVQFSSVVFEHVDLTQSQFIDFVDEGVIYFKYVNLIGSNLNVTMEKRFRITDSILPNGTYKTSFMSFGIDLIKNGDAEQGPCYHWNQSLNTITPQDWSTYGDVVQIYYENNSDWKMNSTNNTKDWHSCFFSGSYRRANANEISIRQQINVEQLSVLINARRARYHVSGYLGGFESEQSSTTLKVHFKSIKNITVTVGVGSVTNVDRQNKTAMLYRFDDGTIPINTISIDIELIFSRLKKQAGLRYGMADNLKLIIQQK